jgi:hypothetical protein
MKWISIIVSLILALPTVKAQTAAPVAFDYRRDFKAIVEKTQDRSSEWYYQKLLIRFLNNDSSLTRGETLALMIGFTENPHYKPLDIMEKETEIFELSKAAEFQEVINKSRVLFQTVPLSMLALRETSIAYFRLSKKDSGQYFAALNDRMMEAMIYSGKGKKPETAFFSLGLADGEYFIPNIGYEIEKKDTEWSKAGDFMEVIDAVNDQAAKTRFYFVIQHAKLKIDDDRANEMSNKKKKATKKKSPKDKNEKPVDEKPQPGP